MRFVLPAAVLVGVGALMGCSDAAHRLGGFADAEVSSGGGSTGQSEAMPAPCENGAGDLDLIDDMEDADGSIDTHGRAGVWFSFNDGSFGGIQTPPSNAEKFSMQALEPPRGQSRFAARTVGSQFKTWGAGIGFDLRVKKAYDASRAVGLAFWARTTGGQPSSLRLNVPDRNTSSLGGVCDEANQLCNDSFGAELELHGEWRLFSFTWSELSQRGWSTMVYPSLKAAEIYGIRFQIEPEVEFAFEIDDIAFTCSG